MLTCSARPCLQSASLDGDLCYFHQKIREGLLEVPYGGVFSVSRRRDRRPDAQREGPSEPLSEPLSL